MPSLASLQRQLWVSSRKLAEKHLGHARQLLSSQEPADIHSALGLLDTALKLSPRWEKAIELKARALLCLRRFKDVANLLQDHIPSLTAQPIILACPVEKEKVKLLAGYTVAPLVDQKKTKKASLFHCFSFFPLKSKVWISLSKKGEKEQWRYIVLGQACCHLGMMEDAKILLSNGKKAASAASRKQSNLMREDSFGTDTLFGSDSDLVTHLLSNIKLLLRRRTAALAALEAGLYSEAARHFSKIIDGRRGTPQGFIAECYMHRAMAYQAANRMVDAIADCNRTLALNPFCAEALGTRATLYEVIGCFTDCLHDLEQLKAVYETLSRNYSKQDLCLIRQVQNTHVSDFQGCIDFISSRSTNIRERMNCCRHGYGMVDYHMILGVSRSSTIVEVERAYLLLSLKHRPDKAAHFVDRCEFVDERDIEVVKDDARSSGLKLFRLIQQAYTGIMSWILEEEKRKEITMGLQQAKGVPLPLYWIGCNSHQDESTVSSHKVGEAHDPPSKEGLLDEGVTWFQSHEEQVDQMSLFVGSNLENNVLKEPSMTQALETFGDVGQLVDASLWPQISTCRELANVGSIISQGRSSDAWMGASEWSHQAHSPSPLSVT